ncbi:MAG: SRPBCC family protein [Ekhidna sp.]
MSKVKVERSVKINAPAEVVFPALSDFHQWIKWSPWLLMEPEAKVKIADDNKSYEWDGDRLGSGNMRMRTQRENEYIDFDLNFIKPWKSSNTTSFQLSPTDGGTEVTWIMESSLPFYLFWMKKMMKAFVGSDYERGLGMLKSYVEAGEIHSRLEFSDPVKFESCQWIGIQTECTRESIAQHMEEDYGRIHAFAEINKDLVAGSPFTIYSKWDLVNNRIKYIASIPVSKTPEDIPAGFETGRIPEVMVQKIRHIGAYKYVGNAWATGQAMMRNKEFKHHKKLYPFEVYLNDPKTTPEKDLIAEIHFPIK